LVSYRKIKKDSRWGAGREERRKEGVGGGERNRGLEMKKRGGKTGQEILFFMGNLILQYPIKERSLT